MRFRHGALVEFALESSRAQTIQRVRGVREFLKSIGTEIREFAYVNKPTAAKYSNSKWTSERCLTVCYQTNNVVCVCVCTNDSKMFTNRRYCYHYNLSNRTVCR